VGRSIFGLQHHCGEFVHAAAAFYAPAHRKNGAHLCTHSVGHEGDGNIGSNGPPLDRLCLGENDQPALERLDLYQEVMTMAKLPLSYCDLYVPGACGAVLLTVAGGYTLRLVKS
jgi:hypothetical protein